jgi:hypothetical protein
MSRKIDRTSSTTSRWTSRATGEPMWRLSSQKREIVLAITVGIASTAWSVTTGTPLPPFGCLPAPERPPRLGLPIVECGWRLRACWVFVPRAIATNRCVCAARYARLPIDDANCACFDPAR